MFVFGILVFRAYKPEGFLVVWGFRLLRASRGLGYRAFRVQGRAEGLESI